ncbi:MAG: hypothetical protein SAK29_25275, partial [Scytonema sp. PMC 1069.18]|nr:hypothetical protein [Scytonema sp. PMC 1069.18]MEC4886629.1 hypothetical protein [Scytonema sp. PMC 1070.18]
VIVRANNRLSIHPSLFGRTTVRPYTRHCSGEQPFVHTSVIVRANNGLSIHPTLFGRITVCPYTRHSSGEQPFAPTPEPDTRHPTPHTPIFLESSLEKELKHSCKKKRVF